MENKRILVVDDEKLIVEYVSMGLEMEGYEVISFTEPKIFIGLSIKIRSNFGKS